MQSIPQPIQVDLRDLRSVWLCWPYPAQATKGILANTKPLQLHIYLKVSHN